jgi:hypothetical protein
LLASPTAWAQNCSSGSTIAKTVAGTSYTIAQADICALLVFTSGSTVTINLPAPGTGGGFMPSPNIMIFMKGAGAGTLTPLAGGGATPTINGSSTMSLASGSSVRVFLGTDGNWYGAFNGANTGSTVAVANGGTGVTSGTAGNEYIFTGSTTVVAATPASAMTTPSNQTGISGATGAAVMLGLGGATGPATLTPVFSGRVRYTLTGSVVVGTANDGVTLTCSHGTGTAPANNAALTGTQDGAGVSFVNAASTTEKVPFSCTGVVTGLTLSTAVWFDLAVLNITGGTATITGATFTASEF